MRLCSVPVDRDHRRDRVGHVYFVACNNEFVKIGFAFDVKERLAELQTSCPYELVQIGLLGPTRARTEKWFHDAMREERVRGEWFKLNERVRLMVHYVNRGFYPTLAIDVDTMFRNVHLPEIARQAPGVDDAEHGAATA